MSESVFTIHRFEIPFSKFGEPFYLIPFGDIHRFADNCDVDHYLRFLEWAKTKERCFFLGMGDYDDFASTAERQTIKASNFHDTTNRFIEDVAKERTLKFAQEIEFMRGRIIGMIEGNHYFQFMSGVTSTQMICEHLKCKYLGISSFIRLSFGHGHGSVGVKRKSVDIWAHHGLGAGRRAGASVNRVEDMLGVAEADIYLMGHDHKKWVDFANRLYLGNSGNGESNLRNRKILLGRTGSFQKGYIPNKSNYVSSRCMPPSDLGVIKIELTPKIERHDLNGKVEQLLFVDIHASI